MDDIPKFVHNLRTCGRKEAERFEPASEFWAVISITDIDTPNALISRSFAPTRILRLQFEDVDPIAYHGTAYRKDTDDIAMLREEADIVVRFLKGIAESADGLLIHCEAGISRSVSMSHAIRDFYTNFPMSDRAIDNNFIYNQHVYQLTYNALRRAHGMPEEVFGVWRTERNYDEFFD